MSNFATAPRDQAIFTDLATVNGSEAENPLIEKAGLQGSSDMSLQAIDQLMAGYEAQPLAAADGIDGVLAYQATTPATLVDSSLVTPSAGVANSIRILGDGNNSLGTAQDLDSLTGLRSRQGHVGGSDRYDYFKFELGGIRDLTLSLTGVNGQAINGDLDLRLIHDKNNNGQIDSGEVLASSSRGSSLNESLNKVLAGGTYFAEIKNHSGSGSQYEFRANAKLPQVNVDISSVRALNSGIDFGSQADFYSKITIDGSTKTTHTVSNDNTISPNWSHSKTVSGNSRYVNIAIQMWDNDSGLGGSDDRIDIDAGGGRDINVRYDLLTNKITGDLTGSGGVTLSSSGNSGDRARTSFKVTEGDWYDRNLGDNNLTNLTRNASSYINRNEMITLLRETKDYGSVTSTELTDLRTIVDDLYQPEYVDNLAGKVVNGDVANTRSGIGNLSSGASATQMERLIGKWFLGNDRPDAAAGTTYRYTNGSLFQNGLSTDDIDQGSVGDCYFMASLGAAAQDKPHVINNMFTNNGDGTFTVRFFKPDGSRDYVTVDRYLATNSNGTARYAGWGGGTNTETDNELWVALAEKAYAQVNESGWIGQDNTNSYAGISGGWMDNVMEQITGYDTTSKNANSMSRTELVNLVNSNKMLTVGFVNGTIPGVVNNHAYTITSYDSSTGLFQLDNPWGSNDAQVTFAQLRSMQGRIQYTNV